MHNFADLIGYFGWFGGISAVILAASKARIDRMKAERQLWQQPAPVSESAILAELKAMRQQMEQMQSTSHQFDIAFDESLSRLEGRISRLETKSAAGMAESSPLTQQIGREL